MVQVHKQNVDVIIVGGGITGCGIALDAVTRGLSTVVFEMQDFCGRYIKPLYKAGTRGGFAT
ncbi:hypothetical protein GCM10020331_089660 [Ectobacillus funiculus]